MVLMEDIEFIDSIISGQYKGSGIDISAKENRKILIAERKAVIHKIITEWQAGQERTE